MRAEQGIARKGQEGKERVAWKLESGLLPGT